MRTWHVLEAGDDDGGEVNGHLRRGGRGGAFARVKDAAELGEEEVFVEGLLDPALGVAGELAVARVEGERTLRMTTGMLAVTGCF